MWRGLCEGQQHQFLHRTACIRPILAGHCFNCHGPDEASREADLRLDTEDGVQRVLLTEGRIAELLERVTCDDHDLLMPPPSAKKPLTAAQITLLRRWVEADAPWGKHWAFEQRPPEQRDQVWTAYSAMHLLGIDHERLTYLHQGRDFRLTDVHSDVVQAVLA